MTHFLLASPSLWQVSFAANLLKAVCMRVRYIWVLALLLAGCQTPPTDPQTAPEAAEPVVEQEPVQQATIEQPEVVAEPEPEPEPTPQEQQDLWKRISMQFSFDIPQDKAIAYYRTWYIKHPNHLRTVSRRATPFMYIIVEKLEQRELPLELALLPIVESSFDPFAYSPGSAAGLWQFIPVTAERFGLDNNYWYDGRRDVDAATDAALDYMTYLGKRFDGDWQHAIAAYNSGGGRVSSAIRRNKKAGKPTDFFSLPLPEETRGYVPKLLALSQILSDPEKYGVEVPSIPNKPVLAKVDPKEQLDLAIAAQYAGISVKELQSYNPGFNQWATPPEGPHYFLIPQDKAEQFEQKAEENRGKGVKLIRYKIQPGDSLSVIARKHKTTTDVIKKANSMSDSSIRAGRYILVPTSTGNSTSYELSANNRLARTQAVSHGQYKTTHTVVSGDSFWSLAKKYKVDMTAIPKWNGMAPRDSLRVGQKLVIWQSNNNGAIIRTVYYNVRSGDTISGIASRFNVRTADVVNWNSLNNRSYLKPGQKLKLYVDVTKSGS